MPIGPSDRYASLNIARKIRLAASRRALTRWPLDKASATSMTGSRVESCCDRAFRNFDRRGFDRVAQQRGDAGELDQALALMRSLDVNVARAHRRRVAPCERVSRDPCIRLEKTP